MTLLMDPELFTIQQNKEMAIWPTSGLVAEGLWPYIKRMRKDKVAILDVGVMKGENAYRFFERDTHPQKKKIDKIRGVVSYSEEYKKTHPAEFLSNLLKILDKNMKTENKFELLSSDEDFDIVCINSDSDLSNNLEKYYPRLQAGSIFCGNDHSSPKVKEALSLFRRKNKIGTFISISHGCWFWVKG